MLGRKSTKLGMFLRKKHKIREFVFCGGFSLHYQWFGLIGVLLWENIRPTLTCYKIPGIIQSLVVFFPCLVPESLTSIFVSFSVVWDLELVLKFFEKDGGDFEKVKNKTSLLCVAVP